MKAEDLPEIGISTWPCVTLGENFVGMLILCVATEVSCQPIAIQSDRTVMLCSLKKSLMKDNLLKFYTDE